MNVSQKSYDKCHHRYKIYLFGAHYVPGSPLFLALYKTVSNQPKIVKETFLEMWNYVPLSPLFIALYKTVSDQPKTVKETFLEMWYGAAVHSYDAVYQVSW